MGVIQDVFEEFGFEPLQTPAIELQETLMGKYGPDAERLIYAATHRGGKQKLNLRYDLSVPLCRVVAQYPDLIKPFKRYQMSPVWRADRPQKGRYREFYQCDADTVGSSSMLADAETLNIIYEILTRLGFKKFVMRINDRKIITGIGEFAGIPEELLGGLYRSIDKLAKIGVEGVKSELRDVSITGKERRRFHLNNAGISESAIANLSDTEMVDLSAVEQKLRELDDIEDSVVDDVMQKLRGIDLDEVLKIPDDVIARLLEFLQIDGTNREVLAKLREWLGSYPNASEGITELEEVITYLEALEIPEDYYRVAPAMVRGLAYYTGPIYETEVEEPKVGSITGGGRFDNLVGMFMDHSYPATGTTIGIERIIDVMEELNMFPPEVGKTVTQVLMTQFNPELVTESIKVARDLRKAGINTEMYFENDPLGDQIRYALNKGIPCVAILGPDEVEKGQVTIRNLPLNVEKTVAREEVATQIQNWF